FWAGEKTGRLKILPLRVVEVQSVTLGTNGQDFFSPQLPETLEGGGIPDLHHPLIVQIADDEIRVQNARGHVPVRGDVHPAPLAIAEAVPGRHLWAVHVSMNVLGLLEVTGDLDWPLLPVDFLRLAKENRLVEVIGHQVTQVGFGRDMEMLL